MRRRSLVLLVSAITLGVLGILATSFVLLITRTDMGREWVRGIIQPLLARKIQNGNIYVGKLGGNFITEITVDSFAIRDKSGELFVSTGRVSVSIDPRDFIDNRIVVRRARVEHPYVHIVEHADGNWNFRRIFASKDEPGPQKPKDPKTRAFGDYFVIDSTWVRGGTFLLTMPWEPDDSLRGAARDSAIRVHLENPAKMVTRRADGFGRTYSWTNAHGLLRRARLADPDSNRFGRQFVIDTLSADEYEPTFKFRNVSGNLRHLGDTIWFDVPHFDMPASTGHGTGKVVWGSDRPVRYDIAIRGDSVSLDDVSWVYATLPRTGGGSLDLLIQNDPKNEHVIDFHLRNMDVRSTKSHLVGNMSFGINAPVLLVRHVALRADPVDFDLIRTLNGKPFPYDWRGQLVGTVNAQGGPVTNFVVDDARGTFRDAHVPGAVSRFSANGELDIFEPALTAFHGLRVDATAIDLRTIQFLNPNFPRIGGIVSGTATLDSSWLDVRFSDANVLHQDGPGEPSRVTGNGRITYGELMTYDVTLDAQPLSLTTLARSYPTLPFRGLVSGPIRAQGQAPDLLVTTTLQGDAGAFSFDGRIDIDSIGGYGASGRGSFSALNLAELLDKPSVAVGLLSGHYENEVAGETAATLKGFAEIDLDTTRLDGVRVSRTRARAAFTDGRMTIVDSVRVQTEAGVFFARGGFGLPKGRPDTLVLRMSVDSLGGLRRYLATHDTSFITGLPNAPDSLSGSVEARAVFAGTMDAFSVSGQLTGRELYVDKNFGDQLTVTAELRDLPKAANGIVDLRADSVTLGGVAIDTIGGRFILSGPNNARFAAGASSRNGPALAASGRWETSDAEQTVVVDSLGLTVGDARWRLDGATRISFDSTGGVRLDSLLLRNRDSAFIALAANVPSIGPAFARLRASRVPLSDVAVITQLADSIRGFGDATLSVTGTKAEPHIDATAQLSSVTWRKLDIDRVTSSAEYHGSRADIKADIVRRGRTAISARASLPVAVSLFSIRERDDSLSGSVRADSADLEIVKAALKPLNDAEVSGRLGAKLELAGTWRAPVIGGRVSISDGQAFMPQMGVPVTRINGEVVGTTKAGGEDSLSILIKASTEGRPEGRAQIEGFVRNLLQKGNRQEFSLALTMHGFHALNKRSTADLYITTLDPIRLRGTTQTPTMRGSLRVDRGSIFLADRDIARKQPMDVFADSVGRESEGSSTAMFAALMTNLRPNVTITLGEDVRLRSAEANVRLTDADSLRLVTSASRAGRPFDIEGTLKTVGGSYNLNLGFVQREFTVLPEGTVTFDGDPKNPVLDIKAQHNVKRPGDRELGVIVNLHGRLLPNPLIDFSSNAEYSIAPSDLISYLLIGRAGLEVNDKQAQAIASFIAPTLSAYAADQFRRTPIGSWVDAFQFQLGTANEGTAAAANNQWLRESLYGATIGAEKQFKSIFVSLNTGFCGFGSSEGYDLQNALGAKAEWRLAPKFAVKASYDPPTSGRVCTQNFSGLIQSPRRFGLSLAHTWRF